MKNQFGKTISELRRQNGWSQKETALKLGVSQALLSHYEKGIRECGLDFLIKASKVFNCSTDYLLGITDRQEPSKTDTDSISADLKQFPKFEKSRNDTINVINLLYSITARLGNPEICKDFSKIMNSEVYIISQHFKNCYFDNNFFKKEPQKAEFYAEKDKIIAFANLFGHFSKENINLNLNAETLKKEYPTCSKSLFSIINNFE